MVRPFVIGVMAVGFDLDAQLATGINDRLGVPFLFALLFFMLAGSLSPISRETHFVPSTQGSSPPQMITSINTNRQKESAHLVSLCILVCKALVHDEVALPQNRCADNLYKGSAK